MKRKGLTKYAGTNLLLDCTLEEYIMHLNNNDEGYVFGDEITFGKLDIDHIRPFASIMDPRCLIQLMEICCSDNTQLMTKADNKAKGSKWSPEEYARTPAGMAVAAKKIGWIARGICKCELCVPPVCDLDE
jgi:hypothetical protein